MKDIFYISDPHFGHTSTWAKFKNNDGTPLRPFTSDEEMNQTMIDNWNRVVKPQDKVYCLGDVVINKKFLPIIKQLHGHKRLVRGNHDIFATKLYLEAGFEEVYGVRVFVPDFICSHIPLHPHCITRFKYNLHGHLHGNRIMYGPHIDPRYFSVSVEQINYTPIHHEEAKKNFQEQVEKYPIKELFEKYDGPVM